MSRQSPSERRQSVVMQVAPEKAKKDARSKAKKRGMTLAIVLVFGAGLGVLLMPELGSGTAPIAQSDVNKPAGRDVMAARDFEFLPAREELDRVREEASAGVQPVFDLHTNLGTEILGKIHAAFAAVRREGEPETPPPTAQARKASFIGALEAEVTDSAFEALQKEGFSDELRAALVFLVGSTLEERVIQKRKELGQYPRGIRLRHLVPGSNEAPREEEAIDYRSIVGLDEAERALSRKVEVNYGKLRRPLRRALVSVGQALLSPNLRFNQAETEKRQQKLREAIVPRSVPYVTGQIIVREGDLVTAEHLRVVQAMASQHRGSVWGSVAIGAGLFVALLLGVLLHYSTNQMRRLALRARDLVAMGTILVFVVATCKAAAVVAARLEAGPTSLYPLIIPVVAGPMLVKTILGARATLLFTVALCFLSALALGRDVTLAAYYLVTGIAGAAAMGRVQSRGAILRAGLIAGGVAAAAALSLRLFEGDTTSVFQAIGLAVGSGILGSLLATSLLPVIEAAFGYTTDITLLELANLSHPLLRDLSLRAPGTYHHSMIVGNLAEEACQSISANGLLARVSAYFHDVGKGKNAAYFAENFRHGHNPHSRLKASMSALIIRSHIKDTVDLLSEHGVPKIVIDTACQHHGTTLIEYFHHKASESKEEDEDVREEDYRYQGRRPQSREAGVLMVADSVEAAARSLAEPDDDRIKMVVSKIINKKFGDGQLNECDLTLRDLNQIARSFRRVLGAMYHGRPAYPWQKERTGVGPPPQPPGAKPPGPKPSGAKPPEGKVDKERGDANNNTSPRPRSKTAEFDVTIEHAAEGRGDLKRLGMD